MKKIPLIALLIGEGGVRIVTDIQVFYTSMCIDVITFLVVLFSTGI